MHKRRIQLIAGTTYTISLPKDWVRENGLKEKQEVSLYEKKDRSLVISPHSAEEKRLNEISLNIDEYLPDIDQILFGVYYLGVENINLFSKKELSKDVRAKIRKAMTHMSGTEISYEDRKKMTIKVLLDKSKVDVIQLFYRISLILDSSISNMAGQLDIKEIRINENEIDRLYHLIAKMISLSLTETNILCSSRIMNVSSIPAFFLISKRLENMGDNVKHLSEYLHSKKIDFNKKELILPFIRTELNRSISYFLKEHPKIFLKSRPEQIKAIDDQISGLPDKVIRNYLEGMIRQLINIEEEIVNISFYSQLIKDKLL